MRAALLDAEWAPRDGAAGAGYSEATRWAANANLTYRAPSLTAGVVDDPAGPGATEVVIEVGACGICGSDLHMVETDDDGYMLLPYHMRCPVVPGHELAGRVVAKGKEVDELRVGELVTVEEMLWCGRCVECRGGFPNQCRNLQDLGFTVNGGFAEYVRVDAKYCWSLDRLAERLGSEDAALEVGAMSEPLSGCYEAIFTRAGGFQPGRPVAVFGAGPIGLASVALAQAAGASTIFCVEPVAERRQVAGRLGATHLIDPTTEDPVAIVEQETRGGGVAMAVECSGNFPAVVPALEGVTGVGGRISILGMDGRPARVDFTRMQLKASRFSGGVGHSGSWNFRNVIELMASGRVRMEEAITSRYALEQLPVAIEKSKDRTDGKILIKPGGVAS